MTWSEFVVNEGTNIPESSEQVRALFGGLHDSGLSLSGLSLYN